MLCHAKPTTITDLITWGQNLLADKLPQYQIERVEARDLGDIQPVIFWGRFGALATVNHQRTARSYSVCMGVFVGRAELVEVGGACKDGPRATKEAQPDKYSPHCLYTETDLHTRQILNFGAPPKCSALGAWCRRTCRRRRRARLREVCA